ncbi:hypothetical protein CBL_00654 [Carabus blaptoides fortunei]
MQKWWVWTFTKHNTGRRSFLGLGMIRCWEVLPVVIIPTAVLTSTVLYFVLYYARTRTEINTKFWPPLYETMDLYKPVVAKFRPGSEYRDYKPLVELDDVLRAMFCAEQQRRSILNEQSAARRRKEDAEKCKCHRDE